MLEVILKVLNSNIMFYVVTPIILIVLGWIKGAYDDSKRKKEYGIWIKKYERVKTFCVIMLFAHKILAFIFIVALFIFLFLELLFSSVCGYIVSGIFYLIGSTIWIICLCKNNWLKVELLNKGRYKKVLVAFLYSIYTISLLLATIDALFLISYIVFIILHIILGYFLFKEYDLAFKIENQYVDIYVQGCDIAECVEARTVKKKDGWVTGEKYKDGKKQNVFIKESEIVKVNYHEEPIIIVERIRPFRKYEELTRKYHNVFRMQEEN